MYIFNLPLSRSEQSYGEVEMHSVQEQKFPFSVNPLETEVQKKIDDTFQDHSNLVQIGPEKCLMPGGYSKFADTIWNFEVRPSDVFICTFPRSGTTWTQEMIWLICNDLDYESALKTALWKRFDWMEFVVSSGAMKN